MPAPVREGAAIACALVMASAGCGSARPTNGTSHSTALAFAHCMRANGVPRYPDPAASGQLVKGLPQQLAVSSARFQSAESACRRLLPNRGSPPSAAQMQQVRALSLHFAECVRAHGLPNFPDPDNTGRIPDPASAGIDQGAPKFEAANQACAKYRPPYMPSNAAYNAYARTHRP